MGDRDDRGDEAKAHQDQGPGEDAGISLVDRRSHLKEPRGDAIARGNGEDGGQK